MKIQIRKVNGVPMGRPCNPFQPNDEWRDNPDYIDFEQSVTEHEAPGFEEGEAEGVLIAQMYDDNDGYEEWTYSANPDRDRANGYTMRQIWIVSTPEKVEVKEVNNWIRVEDQKPPYYTPIFIYNHYDSSWALAWYASDGDNGFYTVFGTDMIIYNITHWQLTNIPSPPTL